MNISAGEKLNAQQVENGLQRVLYDGLATEAMSCLTEGTFLVALALQLGASNFQIGLLAALPTFTNVFQILAIRLVRHYKSRRLVTVVSLLLARLPLFLVAALPFFVSPVLALPALTVLMFLHYFFGSVAGASWNSWVKDLVPEKRMGSYFSYRIKLTQTLNVVLSVSLAFGMDFLKKYQPSSAQFIIPILFILGAAAGMVSVLALAKAAEPVFVPVKQNLWKQFLATARNANFRKLIAFHSSWIFAFNLATPFFSVYMIRTMHLPVSYILFLNIASQLSSIFFVKKWGQWADAFSNKNVIRLCVPLYALLLVAWVYTASLGSRSSLLVALVCIHVVMGIATSGINLSLNNISMKLAPRNEAMMFMASRNTITALFSAAAPLAGGAMADFFASRQLSWNLQWQGASGTTTFHLLTLHQWNFFFMMAAVLCLFSMRFLKQVTETGEVSRKLIWNGMITKTRFNGLRLRQRAA